MGTVNGRTRDLPTAAELGIEAELWNALARRVSRRVEERSGHRPLFSTRNRAAIIAVMALDAATDEWLVGYEARMSDGNWCDSAASEVTP